MEGLITTDEAAEILANGGIVGLPTETVYGLAARAYDETAVLKVYKAKNRPTFNPLIVHVSNTEMLEAVVSHIPPNAKRIIDVFWPGPLSLLLKKSDKISDLITAGSPQVVVRMPRHPLFLEVLNKLGEPLVAPSANSFCKVSPTTAEHVLEQLISNIDGVVDGGPCEVGIESSIVGFDSNNSPLLYRHGGISVENLESVLGENVTPPFSRETTPGSLKKHYAPDTRIVLVDNLNESQVDRKDFKVWFFKPGRLEKNELTLSADGSLESAASRLYKILHEIDSRSPKVAYVESAPKKGLGVAINDRLSRAAS